MATDCLSLPEIKNIQIIERGSFNVTDKEKNRLIQKITFILLETDCDFVISLYDELRKTELT